MQRRLPHLGLAVCGLLAGSAPHAEPPKTLEQYYAHPVREDRHGVIAPWYTGLNGQLDQRALIAVDVYKRYPWVGLDKAVMAAPDFVYNSHWSIKPDGEILIPPTNDWMCGDLSQRVWSIVKGLTAYYMYSGDPIAMVYIPLAVDYVLDYGLTPEDHPWPRFPISTPTKGKAYGQCDPTGRNQLDLCAILGTEVVRAYKLTGNKRYLEAVQHWGDVFAEKCRFDPELSPWDRYVDPSVVGWSDVLTGSTALITHFLDDLIDLGYKGKNGAIVKARNQAVKFLNERMLPKWLVNDTWGRSYWDWDSPVIVGTMSMIADHIMVNADAYPTWKQDLPNIMTVIFNRNSADANSKGDMYSGAWAFPESCVCCQTSLSYCQYTAAPSFIRFGALANDPWASEIGRRMILMATYDSKENGVVLDGLLGQAVATGEWSNLAHPWPLCQVMESLAWMPEELGANRENHIVRSTSVVNRVSYEGGKVAYTVFSAKRPAIEVIRLAFTPERVTAGRTVLKQRDDTKANGFTVKELGNGDCIVTVRHDGAESVTIEGSSTEKWVAKSSQDGAWVLRFAGNRVRVLGTVGPDGGWADAYLDGEKVQTLVEFWNPRASDRQVVFERKGLSEGDHELRIEPRGKGNTLSKGATVRIEGAWIGQGGRSAGFGEGQGPKGAQRMVFGYGGRKPFVDSQGNAWRPATEFCVRSGFAKDTVAESWWTDRRSMYIGNTDDPELYRYGVHGADFWVNLTVAPGSYDVTLKFADTSLTPWLERRDNWQRVIQAMDVEINGAKVLDDFCPNEAAKASFTAVDRTFKGIRAQHGSIRIEFKGTRGWEAAVQALEIVPSGS